MSLKSAIIAHVEFIFFAQKVSSILHVPLVIHMLTREGIVTPQKILLALGCPKATQITSVLFGKKNVYYLFSYMYTEK